VRDDKGILQAVHRYASGFVDFFRIGIKQTPHQGFGEGVIQFAAFLVEDVGVVLDIHGKVAFFGFQNKCILGVTHFAHHAFDFHISDGLVGEFLGSYVRAGRIAFHLNSVAQVYFRFLEASARTAKQPGRGIMDEVRPLVFGNVEGEGVIIRVNRQNAAPENTGLGAGAGTGGAARQNDQRERERERVKNALKIFVFVCILKKNYLFRKRPAAIFGDKIGSVKFFQDNH